MAAYIITSQKEYCWHIGEPLPNSIDIQSVTEVQIDGDEMSFLPYTFNQRVQRLDQLASQLYCLLIKEMYKNCKPPIVTEEGINILLQGKSNPQGN